MPTDTRIAKVPIPEAESLADLYSIQFDLETARTYCQLALKEPRDWPGTERTEAFVIAAVIKYTRCFTSGVRVKLLHSDPDLDCIGPEFQTSHAYFTELRSKFVAHAVNAFEDTYVNTPVAVRDGIKQPVVAVSPGQRRLVLANYTAENLLKLIVPVQEAIEARIKAAEAELLAHLKQLPLEEVHTWDLASATDEISPENVSKRRERHKKDKPN